MNILLATVSPSDFNVILSLTRQKKVLGRVLELSEPKQELSDNLKRELESIETSINEWWTDISCRYGLQSQPNAIWYIDFKNKNIYLTDEKI